MRTSSPCAASRRCRAVAALAVLAIAIVGCTSAAPAKTTSATTVAVDTCRDSAGQQGNDPGVRLVNGVEGFVGDPNSYDAPYRVIRNGHHYIAWKFALAVAPNAGPYRTISVVHPASARLAYPRELAIGVRLPVCGRRYTLYVGGVFVTRRSCVSLAVTSPSGKAVTVTMPVLVAGC